MKTVMGNALHRITFLLISINMFTVPSAYSAAPRIKHNTLKRQLHGTFKSKVDLIKDQIKPHEKWLKVVQATVKQVKKEIAQLKKQAKAARSTHTEFSSYFKRNRTKASEVALRKKAATLLKQLAIEKQTDAAISAKIKKEKQRLTTALNNLEKALEKAGE